MTETWTCRGSVRGDCGMRHRTEDAAVAHCAKDHRDVQRGHGSNAYSDRRPVRLPDPDEWARELLDAHAAAHDAEVDAEIAREHRDALVRELVTTGVTMYRVAKTLGVSETAVRKMVDRA